MALVAMYIPGVNVGSDSKTTASPFVVYKHLEYDLHTHYNKEKYERMAVGYNTNVDLVVDGLSVVSLLGQLSNTPKPANRDKISSLDDFTSVFAHYFAEGSAAERFVDDIQVCKTIVAAATQGAGARFVPGGNAALIAKKLTHYVDRVLLAGALPTSIQETMPATIQYPSNNAPVRHTTSFHSHHSLTNTKYT